MRQLQARHGSEQSRRAQRRVASILLLTQVLFERGMSTLHRTSEEDITPGFAEVEALAAVLESRHGQHAVEVAEFFSTFHSQSGDVGRSWAWAGVADAVRQRERARLLSG